MPKHPPLTDNEAQPPAQSAVPVVSVIIPMRNEERYIETCLRSLLQQDCELSYEIIIVDGRSADRSLEIVRRMQDQHPNILLLDNPAGIVPTAMNLGIRSSRGKYIVRVDAHSSYPPHYVQSCVELLDSTQADNVGGYAVTLPASRSFGARLVAAVVTNPFGVGNSYFRTGAREGCVDTVPFGAFRKELFERIGLFDETLGRNEDNELNSRILKSGGKVYLSPRLAFSYFPANTLGRLLLQTYRSARWHLFTIRRQNGSMKIRHLVPATFTCVTAILIALSFENRMFLPLLLSLMAAYFAAALYFVIKDSGHFPWTVKAAMPFALLAFHITYGVATFAGAPMLLVSRTPAPTR